MTLYKIRSQLTELLEKIEENGGELPPDTEAELDKLELAFDDKVEAVLQYRQNRASIAAALKAEVMRLSAIAEREQAAADRLWKYVHTEMVKLGVAKAGGLLCKVRVQKNSRPSIRTEWPHAAPDGKTGDYIPPGYERIKVEFDSQKAYEDWKADRQLPAGIVVTQGTHLRFA